MEYDRIFSGFTMCNLLGETRYYDDNFVIAYLSVLMKFDYLLSLSQLRCQLPPQREPRL